MSLEQQREELRQLIIEKAYSKGEFILSSGKKSDYYIDARLVTLDPKGVTLIAQLMLDEVKDDNLDAIGGPTLGADPMIGAFGVLSFQSGKPLNTFIIRKEAKGHGKERQVEGPELKAGARIVLVDDVATTGKAFLHSLDVLKEMDVDVVKCICVVDRNDGAPEAVAAKGSKMVSLFNINEIHSS